jgi:hypothetical protein
MGIELRLRFLHQCVMVQGGLLTRDGVTLVRTPLARARFGQGRPSISLVRILLVIFFLSFLTPTVRRRGILFSSKLQRKLHAV